MFLHSLNGHLFSVKYTCGQSGFHIGLFKYFTEVFNLSGTGRGNHRDRDVFANMSHEFNVKATISTILINTVE